MRFMFISIAPPIPTTNGQRLRNRSLLWALKAQGHKVTYVCFVDDPERTAASAVTSLCDAVYLFGLPTVHFSAINRVKSLLSVWPYGAARLRSSELREFIRKILAERSFDAIISDDVYTLINMPSTVGLPLILNKHDLTYEIMDRFIQHEHNPLKRLYAVLERRKAFRLEQSACSTADLVLACSIRDRDVITQVCSDAKAAVVPNVIDTDDYAPTTSDDGKTVLYTGAMDWLPNRDAVEFLAFQIFPLVLRSVPHARLVVAGRGVSCNWQKKFAGLARVRFTGAVPRMQDELSRAAICVVPLRIGSGTRLKILEAGAMGKAVVSTTIGAEGLNFVPGEEILLADSPQEFAAATASLLLNANERIALGAAARRRVEREYGLSALERSLREALACVDVSKRKGQETASGARSDT